MPLLKVETYYTDESIVRWSVSCDSGVVKLYQGDVLEITAIDPLDPQAARSPRSFSATLTSTWQTMETADKNTPILLSDGKNVGEGEWRSAQPSVYGDRGDAGWYWIGDEPHARPFQPAYWMALPSPPEKEKTT